MKIFGKALLLLSMLVWVLPVIAQRADPDSPAYSKVVIENCYEDRVPVRIWVSENGSAWRDRGAWKSHGVLESQWSGSDCPATGEPMTVELKSGSISVIKALDPRCGKSTPINTLPKCHILTTRRLRGDASSPDVYKVRIDTAD